MLLSEVGYARPSSVDEAVRLLAENDGARALAGGQTIVNVMKARAAAPDVLVDLADLEELRAIAVTGDGALELGALATYSQLITSAEVKQTRPIVAEVAAQIADVQVRNRGTVGGNVCSNDPTNHLPPVFVATGAAMTVLGAEGERIVPAEEFFLGVYMTAAGPGELLTKVVLPPAGDARDGFSAVTIGADGTCIVNAAATVSGGRGPGRRSAALPPRRSSLPRRPTRTPCATRCVAPSSTLRRTSTALPSIVGSSPRQLRRARSPLREKTRWSPSRACRSR